MAFWWGITSMIRSSAPECIPPSRVIAPLTQSLGSSVNRAGALTKYQTSSYARDGGRESDVGIQDGYALQKPNPGDREAKIPRSLHTNPATSTYCLTGTHYEWTQKSDKHMDQQWKQT